MKFLAKDNNGSQAEIQWFPSEYLYKKSMTEYCLAFEKSDRSNEIVIGGTLMRQNNFIFDIEENKLGVARASCNRDLNQVLSEQELI
jgi:hypothetical protein